jgi:hypothetical protein
MVTPFHRGGPSLGCNVERVAEWMPSAPIRTSAVAVSVDVPRRSTNRATTASVSWS